MSTIIQCFVWLCIALLSCGVGTVCSQPSSKTIRIVTTGIGGGNDFISRQLAQGIAGPLGQAVIVDNRSSGVAIDIVAKAPPDGATLLAVGNSFVITPLLEKVTYDPVRDFAPVTLASSSAMVLIVHPSMPVRSVKELIALAKARPGELNYSTSQVGSGSQLAGEFFKVMTGVNIVRIPYTNASVELTDLLTGQVQMTFANAGAVTPYIKLGKFRAVAVTSATKSALFPGLPTVAATLAGFEVTAQTAVFAPAKTPDATIRRLNQEMVRFIGTAEVKERFIAAGNETAGSTPDELAQLIKTQMASVAKLIKDAKIDVAK